jgi:hypothetical protein
MQQRGGHQKDRAVETEHPRQLIRGGQNMQETIQSTSGIAIGMIAHPKQLIRGVARIQGIISTAQGIMSTVPIPVAQGRVMHEIRTFEQVLRGVRATSNPSPPIMPFIHGSMGTIPDNLSIMSTGRIGDRISPMPQVSKP